MATKTKAKQDRPLGMKRAIAEKVAADAKRAGLLGVMAMDFKGVWVVYFTNAKGKTQELHSPEELAHHLGNDGMVRGVAAVKTPAEKGSFLDSYHGDFGEYTWILADPERAAKVLLRQAEQGR